MLQRHWYNSCRGTTDYRKAEASRDHSSPNPLPWSGTAGCSRSCPVIFWLSPGWRHHNLWAICSVWQTDIKQKIVQMLPDYSNPNHPISEVKSLISSKTLKAVSHKGVKPQNSQRFPFPNNRLKPVFLGGKENPKPNPQINTRTIAQGKFLLFFSWFIQFCNLFPHYFGFSIYSTPQALVRENWHLPCSCSSSCRASTPLLPEGPAPSSDTDSPSRSREDTELERLEGPGKTDFTLKLIWITVPKSTALTIQDTKTHEKNYKKWSSSSNTKYWLSPLLYLAVTKKPIKSLLLIYLLVYEFIFLFGGGREQKWSYGSYTK